MVTSHRTEHYKPTKRMTDLVGASLLTVMTAPVVLLAMLIIKLSSPGPVFIRQTRLTEGGRRFGMYKMRTMRADAEAKSGAIWATTSDPRITPVGRVLRRYRIDELPQLFNVLRGDMSLIGPRPERPEFAAALMKEYPSFSRRLELKAGLSGLAQVKTGYCSTTEEYRRKIAFDRLYVRHCSAALDLNIAFRTMFVLLTGIGAR